MPCHLEVALLLGQPSRGIQCTLQPGKGVDIYDRAARAAHQVVVMVTGEPLTELESRLVGARGNARHDSGLDQNGEVSVSGTLRQGRRHLENLRDTERARRGGQRRDKFSSAFGVPLFQGGEAVRGLAMDLGDR